MTAEYLDRSSLVARMKYYEEHTTEGSGEHYAYSAALREIRNAPAADVAPVVRCEKCLYRSQYANEDGFYQCGMLQCADEHCALVPPNFACIAGVRRGAKMDGGNCNG